MELDIFKIAAIGLCGVVLASMVKGYKPELSMYVVMATVLILFGFILYRLSSAFEFLGTVYNQISYGKAFFPIILKVLAVAYVTDFASQLCKDAGEGAIASKVELAGKVIIFTVAIPVIMSVLELITKLLPG